VARLLLSAAVLIGLLGGQDGPVTARRFTSELELATERFELHGSEEGRQVEQEGPRNVRERADEIEIEDTPLDADDPGAGFARHYRVITSALRMGREEAPEERTTTAGLEGRTVRFERTADGAYERSCEDAELRKGQLKRLRAELSLRAFLPPEDHEPDEAWEPEPAALLRLVSPLEDGPSRRGAGRAPKTQRGLDLAPVVYTEGLGALMAALEGTLEATPLAEPEGDWPRSARLEFRLTSTFDGSEGLLRGREARVDDTLELEYRGTGSVSWDPDSGRIEVACEGALRLTERFEVEFEGNGATATVNGDLEVSGTLALEASEETRP